MLKDIYDPLTEYSNVFKNRFKEVSEETFGQITKEAAVDIAANHKTCDELYAAEARLDSLNARRGWLIFLCVLLWIGEAAVIAFTVLGYMHGLMDYTIMWGASSVAILLLLLTLVHPQIKKNRKRAETLQQKAGQLKDTAWGQMSILNSLYDWNILARMITTTVPKIEFDPYFTTQRLADLNVTYDWDDTFNFGKSIICSQSGLINGNPFVICRTKIKEMTTKTYYGSKTIYWTDRVMGSDGKYKTVTRSQVLVASVTAPYPEYKEKVYLIYGNTAAPDLIFHRKQNDLAGRENSWAFRRQRRKLRRKARNLTEEDFAMMTNEDFEVAFNTSDRNNNQQFALLFTPLAQDSMLKILRDTKVGYGDDFDFTKSRMINTIISDHMQSVDIDVDPEKFRHFDYRVAQKNFMEINADYFKAIYFALAPLLCVPLYQQHRTHEDIYGHNMGPRSSFWEHESLANYWGVEKFRHPDCVTDCILKTSEDIRDGDEAILNVYAHGYRKVERVSYQRQFGMDGRFHHVPVYWDEYVSVLGSGKILIKEDNEHNDEGITYTQRRNHINNVLSKTGFLSYRRNIASRA